MGKDSILEFNNKESFSDVLNELLRDGAQQLICQAVETELSEYMSQHQRITDDGRLALVRNGYLPEREILTGIGPVSVRIPKVRSKTGQALTFRSALVPPYVRKTRSLEAALPWLYLKGVSSGEMGEALKVLVGHEAQGLSASTVSRLKSEWANEYQRWREAPLDADHWVYVWADGIYSGLREVYPQTRHQRCWVHKTANILNSLPKSSQPKAKEAIHEIWQAETKINAEKAFELFIETYQDKYPKATLSLQKDREELLAFYDFPAKHWQSIRTSNPIESTFGTIRHRTKRSKGCLNREGMLHMMFKLGQCAEKNWRKLRGFDYLAKVIEGVQFSDGIEVIPEIRIAA